MSNIILKLKLGFMIQTNKWQCHRHAMSCSEFIFATFKILKAAFKFIEFLIIYNGSISMWIIVHRPLRLLIPTFFFIHNMFLSFIFVVFCCFVIIFCVLLPLEFNHAQHCYVYVSLKFIRNYLQCIWELWDMISNPIQA